MRKGFFALAIFTLLLAACGGGNVPVLNENQPSTVQDEAPGTVEGSTEGNALAPSENQPSNVQNEEPGSENNSAGGSGPDSDEGASVELSAPDCYGPGVHPVGESIADQFEETDYNEVMTWFCSGAEFDDILLALQTQKLSDQPAAVLLERLANGESWEGIISSLGLND